MAFTKMDPQPERRDPTLNADTIAPGLYPGEVAVRIDMVLPLNPPIAVSAEPKRLANGAGVAVTAKARWIRSDGQSRVDKHRQEIATSTSANFGPHEARLHGARALAKELLLLLLGEPAQLMKSVPLEGGGTSERPVLDVSDEVRLNASIREAIASVADTGPEEDAAAILGI